jgi:ssDNA-binding Zn-finger/Zn-ribbon topoisomerase 1
LVIKKSDFKMNGSDWGSRSWDFPKREKFNLPRGVKDHELTCPICEKKMILRTDSRFKKHGLWYSCVDFPACRGAHGAHKDGEPLGKPADQETKDLRVQAHQLFDQIWKNDRKRLLKVTEALAESQMKLRKKSGKPRQKSKHRSPRHRAYLWLSRCLGISMKECHIGRFDKTQCEQVIRLCKKYLEESRTRL